MYESCLVASLPFHDNASQVENDEKASAHVFLNLSTIAQTVSNQSMNLGALFGQMFSKAEHILKRSPQTPDFSERHTR